VSRFAVSRGLVRSLIPVVLAVCLSGCSSVVNTYGSVTGYIYISADASIQHPIAPVEFYVGGSPPRGFVPWAFATVEVYGTSRQTVADAYGRFSLSGVPSGPRMLVFRDANHTYEFEYYQPNSALVLVPTGMKRSWTVMVYMISDNNLSLTSANHMLADLNEMEEARLDPNRVAVLAFADPLNEWGSEYYEPSGYQGARVYEILRDYAGSSQLKSQVVASPRSGQLGVETDSADPQVMRSFVEWCMAFYPADHYALIIWDHGDGIAIHNASASEGVTIKAIGPDQDGNRNQPGRFIDVDEIGEALSDLEIDLIGFDACLMGGVEVAYELANVAPVFVASQEMIPADGWDYTRALESFQYGASVWEVGVALVDAYADTYKDNSTIKRRIPVATCSAVLTDGLDELVARFGLLSELLAASLVDPLVSDRVRNLVIRALSSARRFGDYGPGANPEHHYYDIRDLCHELASAASGGSGLPTTLSEEIVDRAMRVSDWFADYWAYVYSREVAAGVTQDNRCSGLSLYGASASDSAGDPTWKNYVECRFARDTDWFEVLSRV
jgi:hypothetical protein